MLMLGCHDLLLVARLITICDQTDDGDIISTLDDSGDARGATVVG